MATRMERSEWMTSRQGICAVGISDVDVVGVGCGNKFLLMKVA